MDLGLLFRGRRIDLLIDLHLVAAGLYLGDDLGDRPLLVLRDERESLGHRVDAGKIGDGLGLGVGEGQLRSRQKEVVYEVVAGVAELRQVSQHRRVLLHEGLFVLRRQAAVLSAAGPATPTEAEASGGGRTGLSALCRISLGRIALGRIAARRAGLLFCWLAVVPESCTGRVTSRSVPTLASGLSTCAGRRRDRSTLQ